jgi:hypothetical protein
MRRKIATSTIAMSTFDCGNGPTPDKKNNAMKAPAHWSPTAMTKMRHGVPALTHS